MHSLKFNCSRRVGRHFQLQVLRVSCRRVLQVASVQLRQGEGGRVRLHVHLRLHQYLRSIPWIFFIRGERMSDCAHYLWEYAMFVGIRLPHCPQQPFACYLTHFQVRRSVRALLLGRFATIC